MEGLLNGVVVLATAGAWSAIDRKRRPAVDLGRWLLIVGAYANAIGPWIVALFVGHRVIQPTTFVEYVVVYGFFIPGVLPLVSFLLFVGAQAADRVRGD